jgi:hypothetical protein
MYVYHFDVEEESFASERMVEVQKYGIVFDLFYNGSNDVTAGILPVQLRADLDVFGDTLLRHFANCGEVSRSETVLRRDDDMPGLSDRHALYRILDAANKLVSALRVRQRLFSHVGADHSVVIQFDGILE